MREGRKVRRCLERRAEKEREEGGKRYERRESVDVRCLEKKVRRSTIVTEEGKKGGEGVRKGQDAPGAEKRTRRRRRRERDPR